MDRSLRGCRHERVPRPTAVEVARWSHAVRQGSTVGSTMRRERRSADAMQSLCGAPVPAGPQALVATGDSLHRAVPVHDLRAFHVTSRPAGDASAAASTPLRVPQQNPHCAVKSRMAVPRSRIAAAFAAILVLAPAASSAAPAPPFDVAYRAWDVVTDIARNNSAPTVSGECGKTFRPFVIPGLRRQTRQEQDIAAAACVEAARSACATSKLRRSAEAARKCEEFR